MSELTKVKNTLRHCKPPDFCKMDSHPITEKKFCQLLIYKLTFFSGFVILESNQMSKHYKTRGNVMKGERKTTIIELRNNFHNSMVRLRARKVGGKLVLTPSQVRTSQEALCGRRKCECSNYLGITGSQKGISLITAYEDGHVHIFLTTDGGAA